MNQAVPVDEAIQRAGVPFVSKCVCCTAGHQETLLHLFMEGEVARSVWNFLKGIFDVNDYFPSFNRAAELWIKHSSTSSQMGCLKIMAFSIAIWELWKWRNKVIHDQPEDPKYIRNKITYHLQQLNFLIVPSRDATWTEDIAISSLHLPSLRAKRRTGKWVKWRPSPRDLTVNIHGRNKGNKFQGSFVVRNCRGSVYWCVCRNFGEGMEMCQVLILIIQEAMATVHNSGQRISEIQSDEVKFLDSLRGKRLPPWRWAEQIQELNRKCEGIGLSCVDKESNQAAVLAASGDLGNQLVSMNMQSRPEIKKALAEDAIGIARWSWS